MARYLDYADTYLPGEIYSAGLEDYQLLPQAKLAYRTKKKFKFNPSSDTRPPVPDAGESFQAFLALQNNPERLFVGTARMDQTPFGSLAQYING
jgi:hypothetical protein